jgi:hypothetical protein
MLNILEGAKTNARHFRGSKDECSTFEMEQRRLIREGAKKNSQHLRGSKDECSTFEREQRRMFNI